LRAHGAHLGLADEDRAQLLHVVAEARQPRGEPRDADRARPHVDAAAAGAQVHVDGDDGDALGGPDGRGGGGGRVHVGAAFARHFTTSRNARPRRQAPAGGPSAGATAGTGSANPWAFRRLKVWLSRATRSGGPKASTRPSRRTRTRSALS